MLSQLRVTNVHRGSHQGAKTNRFAEPRPSAGSSAMHMLNLAKTMRHGTMPYRFWQNKHPGQVPSQP
eukprot:1270154-Rhodomonas_salina.1